MEIVNFNHELDFFGFNQGEDVLVDTSVLLAYLSKYDPWHETVNQLFEDHIFSERSTVLLYVTPIIVNETLHLATKSLDIYYNRMNVRTSHNNVSNLRRFFVDFLTESIENNILRILDGDAESTLKQIETSHYLGAADAGNVSIANLYGTSFLTVDNMLVHNLKNNQSLFPNLGRIIFTDPQYRATPNSHANLYSYE